MAPKACAVAGGREELGLEPEVLGSQPSTTASNHRHQIAVSWWGDNARLLTGLFSGHEKHTHSTDGYTAGNSPVPAPALSTSHPFPTFPREIQLSLLKPQTTDVPPQNACLETTKGPLHLLSSLVVLVVLAMVGFNWSY
ncbi:hypothetical protein CB1_000932024 [Camelus ferus]|nr:hypothetical protein CB1_000932024 [Camelus ferus]